MNKNYTRIIKRIFKKHQIPFSEIRIEQDKSETIYEVYLTETVNINQLLGAVNEIRTLKDPKMRALLPIPGKKAIGLCFPNSSSQPLKPL